MPGRRNPKKSSIQLLPFMTLKWALTQTLAPRFYKHKAYLQFEKTNSPICTLLKKHSTSFIMVAELTKKVNIHYHIVISFLDENHKNVVLDDLRSYGFTDCRLLQTESDADRWYDYQMKDRQATANFLISSKKRDYENKVDAGFMTQTELDAMSVNPVTCFRLSDDSLIREIELLNKLSTMEKTGIVPEETMKLPGQGADLDADLVGETEEENKEINLNEENPEVNVNDHKVILYDHNFVDDVTGIRYKFKQITLPCDKFINKI